MTTFPWHKVKVGVWILGARADPERRKPIQEIFKSHGYMLAPVENPGVDEYYVLPELWDDALKTKARRKHPPGSGGC